MALLQRTVTEVATVPEAAPCGRPEARGKFLFLGQEKLYVRGVTYGTFEPDADGVDYPSPVVVKRDFQSMAAAGVNAVRTYTVPPRWLLDLAAEQGLFLLIGLPWEQHVTFLDDPQISRRIKDRVRKGVAKCAGHPSVLGYAVGNEIPSSIVRWHGRRKIEDFLRSLYDIAKSQDPDALVTYVNYPSTEYLQLPFLDLVCFNVYLESDEAFEEYLPRLHNLAGNKPLLMTEMGMDSSRHGETNQARVLRSQLSRVFASGFAGAFVFSWTDEWYRGGAQILDWQFGLTTRWRQPKRALEAVSSSFREVPFAANIAWPRVSVVVCTHNGSRTIRDCCEGLNEMDYPDFEVIVVDDGSNDGTAEIVEEFDFRLIRTSNQGLSAARNTGMEAATGEVIAYLDDDARPDPHWLRYLGYGFVTSNHAAIGGPNIAPTTDGRIAQCVANAPGGPIHVLLTDTLAEHIPGCNLAVRTSCLKQIEGFDRRFRIAGDDVDMCWRLQDAGWTIGYSPAAMVWHHRRNSIKAYWKQQMGYGRAEALLEAKWPERYNALGHVSWNGRIYGAGPTRALPSFRARVYGGVWGMAPFQSIYEPAPGRIASLPLMPEWNLLTAFLGGLSLLALLWHPLLVALPLLALAGAIQLLQAVLSASRGSFQDASGWSRRGMIATTATLHVLQPMARLWGRIRYGLTLWRLGARAQRGVSPALPAIHVLDLWRETWEMPENIMVNLLDRVKRKGLPARPGGQFDAWDLQVCAGLLGCARVKMALEEHRAGKQLFRFRAWPVPSFGGLTFIGVLLILSVAAGFSASWVAAACLAVLVGFFAFHMVRDLSASMGAVLTALGALQRSEQ